MEEHVFQVDIAKYFKVSAALVSKLVKEAQEDPERNFALRKQRKEEMERRDAVKKVVTGLLEDSVPIVNAETVAALVEQKEMFKITSEQVKKIMKEDLALAYRMTRKVPAQANTDRCLLLR